MSVTITEALDQLNVSMGSPDVAEITLYMDAANEWVATRVSDTSPTPVKVATLILLDHLWETQRGPATSPLVDEMVTVASSGYAIPNRVLELLAPYMAAGIGSRPAAASFSFPDAVAFPDPAEWPVA